MASTSLEGYCENCQHDISNGQRIERLAGQFDVQVKEIETATRAAASTLAELMGDDVFDIEFVEGSLGLDAAAELAEIARRVRSLARIVNIRQRMLTDTGAQA